MMPRWDPPPSLQISHNYSFFFVSSLPPSFTISITASMLASHAALFLLLLLSAPPSLLSCNQIDRHALLSFHRQISSDDCCRWVGVACNADRRVTFLSLPVSSLSGPIPAALANLTFLTHLNLSRNAFSGHLPSRLLPALRRLQSLDLSYNSLSGSLEPAGPLPASIRTVDLSSNRFTGSIDVPAFLHRASGLVSFNVSNNTHTGDIPASVCNTSRFLKVLDLSFNQFTGQFPDGALAACRSLEIFRAGFNFLSGRLPGDLYSIRTLKEISLPHNRFSGAIHDSIVQLSNLTVLELQENALTGVIPADIGRLTGLEQLQLHTNSLNGSIPASLSNCTRLTTLLLRNNNFTGEISAVDFSKLLRLQTIDLGNNTLTGNIPDSLCLCRSLTAVRFAYNRLVGEVPPCLAALKSLEHFSVSDNFLSNVAGALKILKNCANISVLFMSRCFNNEPMPDDDDLLHLNGFQNLQILTLGGCQLRGQIPAWIAKLRKIKVLNLSYNRISGPIPPWLGTMLNLFVLNLTKNYLSGELPHEIGLLPALISNNLTTDLSSLALPFLFDSLQYNRLFNLPRGVKVGYNNLSGSIPPEIGRLKLLHILDLNDNNFTGSIPDLSELVNLETLDMSRNHLSGEIPRSLASLSFLSSFSVADNDLEGEIPRGGQFNTFSQASFDGNPKLCGSVIQRSCSATSTPQPAAAEESRSWWRSLPFGLGYAVGFLAINLTILFHWLRLRSVDVETRPWIRFG